MNNSQVLKVSVIVPSYNMAAFLPETIESILKQDYQPLEIIVVDDGSTDNTASVVEPYLDRVRYVYQTNGGEASARNTGIKASSGDALMFVDADDLLPEGSISTLAHKLAQLDKKYCLVHGEMESFKDKTGEFLGISSFRDVSQNRTKIFTEMTNLILASLVRKESIEAVGMFAEEVKDGVITDILMKLCKIGNFYSIDETVYKYRIREGSRSRTFSYERASLLTQQNQERLESLLKGESLITKIRAWSAHYLRYGIKLYPYDRNKSRKLMILSLLIFPFNIRAIKLLRSSFKVKINI